MDTTYIKLDLGYLIDSDWSAIEDYFRIDDSGIWLLEESAPQFRCLTQDERDLFMIHPDANPRFPVLPFPFTMNQFLKFADLPAIELHDFYLFPNDTVDVVAIERLERMNAPAGALARALMFGELPKLAQLKEIQGEAASAYAAPVVAMSASGDVEPKSNLPWWQVAYDIHEMAQNIGAKFHGEQKRASNAAIAREIEKRINDIERNKGRSKKAPNHDTIRGLLTGWVWRPE